jgi:hypothetical protein
MTYAKNPIWSKSKLVVISDELVQSIRVDPAAVDGSANVELVVRMEVIDGVLTLKPLGDYFVWSRKSKHGTHFLGAVHQPYPGNGSGQHDNWPYPSEGEEE